MTNVNNRQDTNALIEAQVGEFLATTNPYEMVEAFEPLAQEAIRGLLDTRGHELGTAIGGQLKGLRRQVKDQELVGGIQHGSISLAARSVVGLTYAEGVKTTDYFSNPLETMTDYIDTFRNSFPQNRRLGVFKNPLTTAAEQEISISATNFIFDLKKAGLINSAGLVYASVSQARAFQLRDKISNPIPRKVKTRAKTL